MKDDEIDQRNLLAVQDTSSLKHKHDLLATSGTLSTSRNLVYGHKTSGVSSDMITPIWILGCFPVAGAELQFCLDSKC